MSYNVLVIPEDATLDHYLLRPLVSALLAAAGKPQARLRVLLDPAVKGVDQALDDAFLKVVIERYPMVDLFLLCVDRDGAPGRDVSVADREKAAQALLVQGKRFLGVAAHQEAEVWCLAGMSDLPKQWSWANVRAERDPKELYYEPYAKIRGVHEGPGGGRELLGREAAGRYLSVRSRCPEVAALETRVTST